MPATAQKIKAAKRTQELAEKLATVLSKNIPSPGEPIVVENRIAQTKSVHVVVIWDAWSGMSPADRSSTILDAYEMAKRLRHLNLTTAWGVTSEEALRSGFLPYSIVTMRREGDPVSLLQLSKAMATAGGVIVKINGSTQLRFPTLEQAENAYRLLSQKLAGPYWAIVQDQPTAD